MAAHLICADEDKTILEEWSVWTSFHSLFSSLCLCHPSLSLSQTWRVHYLWQRNHLNYILYYQPGLSRKFPWNELANKRMHTVFSMLFLNGFNADLFCGSKVITSQRSRALSFAVVGLRAIALCQCKDRTSASVSTVVFHRRIVNSFVIGRYISKANHNKVGSVGIITHLYMWLYMLSVLQPKQAK